MAARLAAGEPPLTREGNGSASAVGTPYFNTGIPQLNILKVWKNAIPLAKSISPAVTKALGPFPGGPPADPARARGLVVTTGICFSSRLRVAQDRAYWLLKRLNRGFRPLLATNWQTDNSV
ncbi:hypothetical protein [Mycobacterium sp. E2733]|uniref:hypothetical protein n=1 Tax=Mycobacterium sp. E2733 TaxID=1834138 RepID=UPI0012EA3852|nr:hypothetical protein [Mycobacterium sp. E2733]